MAKKQINRRRTFITPPPGTVDSNSESDTMNTDENNVADSTDTGAVEETMQETTAAPEATVAPVDEVVAAPVDTAIPAEPVPSDAVASSNEDTQGPKEEATAVAPATFTEEVVDVTATSTVDAVVEQPVLDPAVPEEAVVDTKEEAVEATEEIVETAPDSDEAVVGNTEEVMEPVEELTAEEIIQATANPYTESINVVEVNLAPATPTDESIVESVQALTQQGIDTPPAPDALTVEARETALAEAHDIVSTEVENLCADAAITLSFLTDFVEAMDITRPITPVNAGVQHVRLFNALRSGLENVEENFNIFFGTVLQVVNLHKETVFHPLYASRFIEQAPFRSNSDSRDYLRILDLLRLAADPVSRKQVASQIDLTKTLANFSEAARQKVYAFFNI